MDPVFFHDQLAQWSSVEKFDQLTAMIIGNPQNAPIKATNMVKVLSLRIDDFLNQNQNLLAKFDLPALKKLRDVVNTFTSKENLQPEDMSYLHNLQARVANSIQIAQESASLPSFPNSISSLSASYLGMNDIIKLSLQGEASIDPTLLKQSIAHADLNEIGEFMKDLGERVYSNPNVFRQMVGIFLKHAPIDVQATFFSLSAAYFHHILDCIPSDVPYLDFSQSPHLRDQDVEKIVKNCHKLSILNLSYCVNLTDKSAKAIANGGVNMARLEELILIDVRLLTDKGIIEIAESPFMSSLRALNLANCNLLTDEAVIAIADSPYMGFMRDLNLEECKLLTSKAITTLASSVHMSSLEKLNIKGCVEVDNEAIISLVNSFYMSNLKHLNLQKCDIYSDAMIELANSIYLTKLEYLNIAETTMNDAAIIALVNSANVAHLQYLNLAEVSLLTDAAVTALANSIYLASLRELNLHGCNLLTDTSIVVLARDDNPIDLTNLDLSWCTHVTIVSAQALLDSRSKANLKFLGLTGTALTADERGGVSAILDVRRAAA